MEQYEFFLTDSLEKVFPTKRPAEWTDRRIVILPGETAALQLVYRKKPDSPLWGGDVFYRIQGGPVSPRVRDVEFVPSAFPCSERTDENYLTKEPGLFPDLLRPKKDNRIRPISGCYRSLWIDFPTTAQTAPGIYTIELILSLGTGSEVTLSFVLELLNAALPPQTLIHTEWFHADCLADYYQTEVFGETHWSIIEEQIKMAAEELGVNMLLTPVFTPPLDTAEGGERTTVQLADITLDGSQYSFDFSKLGRWCRICRKYGISYLEIPHLFTQWGAKATPKIIVHTKNKAAAKRFGWHVPADSPAYREFLEQFLPALQRELSALGYDREHVFFHISDEPDIQNMESYAKAKAVVSDLLDGWQITDALSDYSFYESGIVGYPVVGSNHINTFLSRHVPNLWVYYCCAQSVNVPNRFFAMPSQRNRIMGVLMYLHGIKGFLHWGCNFYNSQYSLEHIDPFFNTHAGYAFPSGDSFLIYPGNDKKPWSSIRGEVQQEGLCDLRVLQKLETLIGRERVEELIYDGQDAPFTFEHYPKDKEYLLKLRLRIADVLRSASESRSPL